MANSSVSTRETRRIYAYALTSVSTRNGPFMEKNPIGKATVALLQGFHWQINLSPALAPLALVKHEFP
ncbi:hypothetical protein A0H81_04906 [Grifola frondosa]|uniref:Uncharacterized protein n=1 Tax=Grifola frondosa TaxID=5627 RepID=A0A1C7MG44_GRIFR|nr:hypothetical protein A0H81_04906 [Grifola frondosa]